MNIKKSIIAIVLGTVVTTSSAYSGAFSTVDIPVNGYHYFGNRLIKIANVDEDKTKDSFFWLPADKDARTFCLDMLKVAFTNEARFTYTEDAFGIGVEGYVGITSCGVKW